MTPAQLAALKAAILADPASMAFWQEGNAGAVADRFNAPAEPAFIVWRTSVGQDEIMQNGFDWTRVDNLSVGKGRVWEWMFSNADRSFNPSKANVRAGIEQVWAGTAQDLAVRAAVYVHCKRSATVAEKLFATGTGTTAVPALMSFEGELPFIEVVNAMRQVA